MSRLSSMGRTPISERIKVFDASSSPKKTPPRTPSRPREASITPSVDLKPVPARSQPGQPSPRDPSKPTDGLKRVDKVNRPDSSRTTNVTRSDSLAKTRLTRTDSVRSSSGSSSINASSRKAVTAVSSPRVGKKPIAGNQPVAGATAPKGKASPQNSNPRNSSNSSSKNTLATLRSPIGSKPTSAAQQGRPGVGNKSQAQPKTSSASNQDVKPDVIADIEHSSAAGEDGTEEVERDVEIHPVVFPAAEITEGGAADDESAPELVTAKLIRDMRGGDEAVSRQMQEVTGDATAIEKKCLDNEEAADSQDKEMEALSRRESVDVSKKQSIIVNVEEVERMKNESVTEAQRDEIQRKKKSLIELEAESPYLRKRSVKEATESSSSYNLRKASLASTRAVDTKSYMRKESVKEQLEELTDNQYFTKQALNNATSTTINQAMKLDVEYKEDKISSLGREVADLENRGADQEEVTRLKKQKQELENRLREQEEELDDLAGQVQQLEAGKVKLEADLNQVKKESRRELQCKDDELEDARAASGKKVKVLEQQLEQEHEERINFLRERHELEGKIMGLQDLLDRSGDEEQVAKLKKDLKRTKALLKDAQMMIEKSQNEGTNKVIMRQLKNQLEDAEFARTAAMKARQNAELELADVQVQLEDVSRGKADLDEKNLRLGREKADLGSHLQEMEEELQDVMRKYKASVSAVTTDQITIQDQAATIQTLEAERNKLREQCAEISQRLDHMEGENVSTAQHKRLELKIRELESKLELEKTTKQRQETQISRQKEVTEKMAKEIEDLRLKESVAVEEQKKLSRSVREMKEELATVRGKESEVNHKKGDLEKQLEVAEAETVAVRGELKTALKRVEDLQTAISGELDSENSDADSDSSDEEMSAFLDHHRRAMSVQRERESQMREMRASQCREIRSMSREPVRDIRSMSRDVRASVAREFESATRDIPGVTLRPAEEANTAQSFNVIAEEE